MSSYEEEAHRAWESGDLAAAFSCFRLGANDGQLGCMLDLGYFYDEGMGTLRSKHDAMRWYKRAFLNGGFWRRFEHRDPVSRARQSSPNDSLVHRRSPA